MTGGWIVGLAAAGVLLAASAGAHERSLSSSTWRLDGTRAEVALHLTQRDLSRRPWQPPGAGAPSDAVAVYVTERVRLESGGGPCRVGGTPARRDRGGGRLTISWSVTCPAAPRALVGTLFTDVAPTHVHFARVVRAGGAVDERVLTADAPEWRLDPPGGVAAAAPATLWSDVALGARHIASGWDHLAFVVALVLVAGRLRTVATVVTGFTVAHSVTLALAVLGVVEPDPRAVEALIGLSLALVAVENVWLLAGRPAWLRHAVSGALVLAVGVSALGLGVLGPTAMAGAALFAVAYLGIVARVAHPARLRAAVAFAFGLVHGLGFAGALREAALPPDRLVRALLGFNLGVELGQLAVVLAVWPLLLVLARVRDGQPRRLVVECGSAAVCGLGVFWFVTRAVG